MNLLYVAAFVVLFLLTSCTQHSTDDEHTALFTFFIDDFGVKKKLTGQELAPENLLYPAFIEVIPEKNLLVAIEMRGDFLGKIYTLDSLKFIKSFIKQGVGPSEQLSVSSVGYFRETEQLYVTDIYNRKLYFYAVDSLKSLNTTSAPHHIIDFNNKEVMKALVIDSTRIVDFHPSYHSDSVAVINFFNHEGDILYRSGSYPPTRRKFDPHELISVFSSGLGISCDGETIIVNYYYTDYIDIFNSIGELKKRIKGPDKFDPVFNSLSRGEKKGVMLGKESRRAYAGNAKMNNEMFVLYNGKMVHEENYHTDKLLSFDNQFMPAVLYILNREIFAFDVDWSERVVYGLSHKGDYTLVKFDF